MSDLSRLLGDVYGTSTTVDDLPASTDGAGAGDDVAQEAPDGAPAGPAPAGLPEWADDDVLDEAFARWVPGPPSEAPAAERSMLTELVSIETAAPAPAPEAPAPEAAEPAPEGDDNLLAPRSGWLFGADDAVATTSLESLPTDGVLAAAVDDLPYQTEDVVAIAESATAPRWRREDDDLLPRRTSRRR